MKSSALVQILVVLLIGTNLSCTKKFLDAKPSSKLIVPNSIEDFQSLLEGDQIMTETPSLGELSSDNYFLAYDIWQIYSTTQRNAYIWNKEIFEGQPSTDWNNLYKQIFFCNIVLEGLERFPVTPENETKWKNCKGMALFIRAYAFYNLAQIFAPVFDVSSANSDLGIPLRLTSDFSAKTERATVQETYDRVIEDLNSCKALCDAAVPTNNMNVTSSPAALALLSRVYLSMREYNKAKLAADTCLTIYNRLIDYNQVSLTANSPFPRNSVEVLYRSSIRDGILNVATGALHTEIDSVLYNSYDSNDLRKSIFFTKSPTRTGKIIMKGNYYSGIFAFTGLAMDEVYLNRAECLARLDRLPEALNDLNALLIKRWKNGTFVPYASGTYGDVLQLVLRERRKELIHRGIRWSDLRRLNKEGAGINLKRSLNGQIFTLLANDLRYVLPIPDEVIALTGIPQNIR